MMIGIFCPCLRSRVHRSRPSPSGNPTSRITASNRASLAPSLSSASPMVAAETAVNSPSMRKLVRQRLTQNFVVINDQDRSVCRHRSHLSLLRLARCYPFGRGGLPRPSGYQRSKPTPNSSCHCDSGSRKSAHIPVSVAKTFRPSPPYSRSGGITQRRVLPCSSVGSRLS